MLFYNSHCKTETMYKGTRCAILYPALTHIRQNIRRQYGCRCNFSDINFEYRISDENRNAEVVYSYGDFTLQQRCGERHFHAGIDIDLLEISYFDF